jgi:hypothetical protein
MTFSGRNVAGVVQGRAGRASRDNPNYSDKKGDTMDGETAPLGGGDKGPEPPPIDNPNSD